MCSSQIMALENLGKPEFTRVLIDEFMTKAGFILKSQTFLFNAER